MFGEALEHLEMVGTSVNECVEGAIAALLYSKVSPFSWIRPAGLWCACFMPPPDIVGHFRTLWDHCRRDNVVTDTLWERQYSKDWQAFWRLGHMCLSTVILQFHWLVPHLWGRECSKRTLKAPSKKSFFQQFLFLIDWISCPKEIFHIICENWNFDSQSEASLSPIQSNQSSALNTNEGGAPDWRNSSLTIWPYMCGWNALQLSFNPSVSHSFASLQSYHFKTITTQVCFT